MLRICIANDHRSMWAGPFGRPSPAGCRAAIGWSPSPPSLTCPSLRKPILFGSRPPYTYGRPLVGVPSRRLCALSASQCRGGPPTPTLCVCCWFCMQCTIHNQRRFSRRKRKKRGFGEKRVGRISGRLQSKSGKPEASRRRSLRPLSVASAARAAGQRNHSMFLWWSQTDWKHSGGAEAADTNAFLALSTDRTGTSGAAPQSTALWQRRRRLLQRARVGHVALRRWTAAHERAARGMGRRQNRVAAAAELDSWYFRVRCAAPERSEVDTRSTLAATRYERACTRDPTWTRGTTRDGRAGKERDEQSERVSERARGGTRRPHT